MNDKGIQIILFAFLILGIIFYAFLHFGLGQHLLVKQQISKLVGLEREMAEREFYAQGKEDHIFAGTIAKISYHNENGIWVWSNKGLKYFQADEHTFYSYYDVCAAIKAPNENFQVNGEVRKVSTDIGQWANWVKAGNFVQLFITTPENGGQIGNLREVYAYSFPLFLPMSLGTLCAS